MRILIVFIFLFSLKSIAGYPKHWWKPVPEDQRKSSWEILPHEAKKGELILSKRNELGVFSNLAKTVIEFEGEIYQSVEAFWQMMKYPDPSLTEDSRKDLDFIYTRQEVKQLSGFVSKRAGSSANRILKANNISWISYKNKKFNYKDFGEGSKYHYMLIYRVIEAKLLQNPGLIDLLKSTGDLELRADHKMGSQVPPSYHYNLILMKIRKNLAISE